ncbi:hypothetical protein IP92_05229 [Pseudoduganella flava]|uniref:Uncharacterized protein n=1 Tax=Pseudoduganella flava TaxID=871742 RepID=A0A562PFX6_9BURK|nr:hypothetical protein [Pseudoduganella flava]QGZ38832.1 hypothetical protein GO485_07065 [Pseudoduganella flava]TWI42896.1 hypothetical protein IP92_05229 [Pseudoduganella flava]
MARDLSAYREVAVESFNDGGTVRVRPVVGQAYHPLLRVQCARAFVTDYPVGTRFLVQAKLTDRLGGPPFLYVYHGDPITVLNDAQTKRFLAEFRRGRI